MDVRSFLKESSLVPFVIGVILALTFIFSLIRGIQSSHDQTQTIVGALAARVDDPKQPNVGLEALVRSALPARIGDSFSNSPIPVEVLNALRRIETCLPINRPNCEEANLQTSPDKFDLVEGTAGDGSKRETADSVIQGAARAPIADTAHAQLRRPSVDYYVTEATEGPTFLYIPAVLIRSNNTGNIPDALNNDPDILTDVQRTYALSSILHGLASTFDRWQIVQTYVITARGLIRLSEQTRMPQRQYYKRQFETTLYFPDRKYFRQALTQETFSLDKIGARTSAKNIFHITEPYIDLGGNGVVITLCRRLMLREQRDSALCLDVSLAKTAELNIREKMRSFGARILDGTCWITDEKSKPDCEGFGSYRDQIEKEAAAIPSKESEMFGEIRLVGKPNPAELLFTIPLEARVTGAKRGERLLLCGIDLTNRSWLTWPMFSFASAALFAANFVFALIDSRRRLRVQQKTLEAFAEVMSAARDAYCRVTYDHKFIHINEAFAHMLGYENRESAFQEIKSGTFLDLLDDPSKKIYADITAKHVKRAWQADMVGPDREKSYDVMIGKPRSSERRKATVHGAAVPLPTGPRRRHETFGIILS